jgi:DNA-binding NarL/FixJ family response regulator
MPKIRVAIVDDHPLVREGVAAAVAQEGDLELVELGSSTDDAVRLLRRTDIDVLVLDIRLGGKSGLAAIRAAHSPPPAVLILTAFDLPQYADAALRAGASGYVLKSSASPFLLAAIREVAAGGMAFAVRPTGRVVVSDRELQVIRLVIDGRSNDEIARELRIAPKTVESHLRRLFDRLSVSSRTELATRALRDGWLDLP